MSGFMSGTGAAKKAAQSNRGGGGRRHAEHAVQPAPAGVAQPAVCVRVALPTPRRQAFDYLAGEAIAPGCRVRVPLAGRRVVGVVIDVEPHDRHAGPLRAVEARIDAEPILPPDVLALLAWAAGYYHHGIGEVLLGALPKPLRLGRMPERRRAQHVRATADAAAALPRLARAPAQRRALGRLLELGSCASDQFAALGLDPRALAALAARGLVERVDAASPAPVVPPAAPLVLTADQAVAVAALAAAAGFGCHLLEGVTGSGKTEVYLRAIERVVAAGGQALVLVPEIALTPQALARFAARFARTAVTHSGLADGERTEAWLAAAAGDVDVLVGTRSAVFAPLPRLALIVVDEEHDASFKQQDGFRYSARDVAVKRARLRDVPVVLGSATPSFETLHNVERGRYACLPLRSRPGSATLPALHVEDIRGVELKAGMSQRLRAAIGAQLAAGNQVLVFRNQRGYAPALACAACGWLADCSHCDARMTLHLQPPGLVCHHCDMRAPVPAHCPQCGEAVLASRGFGTERLEEVLAGAFPGFEVLRFDRDVARSRERLERRLERAASGVPMVLVGTQLLAKGHHFPAVTLSVIVNADAGLFAPDYRAPERTAQVITQVAGRAGRAERPGVVWLATHHPEHPVIEALRAGGYAAFARAALAERAAIGLPPHAASALLRGDARDAAKAQSVLAGLAQAARAFATPGVRVRGPVAAPLARRAGRYRLQVWLLAQARPALHRALAHVAARIDALPRGSVRVGIDVDPVDTF
jgi:primosomal protein N' (replication factor Y)